MKRRTTERENERDLVFSWGTSWLVGGVAVLMIWGVLPVTWLSVLGLALLLLAGVLGVVV